MIWKFQRMWEKKEEEEKRLTLVLCEVEEGGGGWSWEIGKEQWKSFSYFFCCCYHTRCTHKHTDF